MIHHFQQYFSYIIKVRYISGGNQYLEKTKDLPQFADKFNCDLHITNKSTLILLKWKSEGCLPVMPFVLHILFIYLNEAVVVVDVVSSNFDQGEVYNIMW
jgi:hypothetical protein